MIVRLGTPEDRARSLDVERAAFEAPEEAMIAEEDFQIAVIDEARARRLPAMSGGPRLRVMHQAMNAASAAAS